MTGLLTSGDIHVNLPESEKQNKLWGKHFEKIFAGLFSQGLPEFLRLHGHSSTETDEQGILKAQSLSSESFLFNGSDVEDIEFVPTYNIGHDQISRVVFKLKSPEMSGQRRITTVGLHFVPLENPRGLIRGQIAGWVVKLEARDSHVKTIHGDKRLGKDEIYRNSEKYPGVSAFYSVAGHAIDFSGSQDEYELVKWRRTSPAQLEMGPFGSLAGIVGMGDDGDEVAVETLAILDHFHRLALFSAYNNRKGEFDFGYGQRREYLIGYLHRQGSILYDFAKKHIGFEELLLENDLDVDSIIREIRNGDLLADDDSSINLALDNIFHQLTPDIARSVLPGNFWRDDEMNSFLEGQLPEKNHIDKQITISP